MKVKFTQKPTKKGRQFQYLPYGTPFRLGTVGTNNAPLLKVRIHPSTEGARDGFMYLDSGNVYLVENGNLEEIVELEQVSETEFIDKV